MNFIEVRNSLLAEAKSSPNLLSDLAGLENYIAESYHNRSFIELLQNADDAKSTKFKIFKKDSFLFVANNGRTFNKTDLESLCRSAASAKIKGDSIGYRGIGFKSVVGFAKSIHIISGDLEITFSKEKTQHEIPQASRVPLIRIPHEIDTKEKIIIQPIINNLFSEGYTTIFIFTGVTAQEIESEFDSFNFKSLIFLKNIESAEICTKKILKTFIKKERISDSEVRLLFDNNGSNSEWYLSTQKESTIAFSVTGREIKKLPEPESLVHAFLPTDDNCGVGVLINGNFSTDPSRRHLIYNNETIDSLKLCGNHILRIIDTNIKKNEKNSLGIVNALIPFSDPRMLEFQKKSFTKLLIEELKCSNLNFFKNLKLCPRWLNLKDYSALIKIRNAEMIDSQYFMLDGFNSLAKCLGASEDTFSSIRDNINSTDISTLGCAQLTQQIFKRIIIAKDIDQTSDLKLLLSDNKRISLRELSKNDLSLDSSFISLLIENGLTDNKEQQTNIFTIAETTKSSDCALTISDIEQVLKKFLPEEKCKILLTNSLVEDNRGLKDEKNPITDWFNELKADSNKPIKTVLKRWRSAEEQTLEVLNQNNFKLIDVSKQNIGYDLEGEDPHGRKIQIEVKSITLPGQKFKLTNNEIAIAQEKQDAFYIAIVRQTENSFEIALIPNPVKNLTLNRQCVQWIWECTDYEYKPIKFEI
ncbi:MAG: DUF3883 domain-containing protein [Minisyncoccales bacterium]